MSCEIYKVNHGQEQYHFYSNRYGYKVNITVRAWVVSASGLEYAEDTRGRRILRELLGVGWVK